MIEDIDIYFPKIYCRKKFSLLNSYERDCHFSQTYQLKKKIIGLRKKKLTSLL